MVFPLINTEPQISTAPLGIHIKISRLVIETCAIALAQAGMQAGQFANAIDHTGNKTNFTEIVQVKVSFFSRLSQNHLLLARAFYPRSVLS